jgi:hypothetical protein
MSTNETDVIELSIELLAVSTKAFRIRTVDYKEREKTLWVPKVFAFETDCIADGDVGYLFVDENFARKAGLIV